MKIENLRALLNDMSLEEKVGQMVQMDGRSAFLFRLGLLGNSGSQPLKVLSPLPQSDECCDEIVGIKAKGRI